MPSTTPIRLPPGRLSRLRALAILAWCALCVGALCGGPLSCGASIQALYEGDVRFEHCMALDARPDVKPTIRRTCWDEWVQFYTFGQTLDRIDHARLRRQQLGSASDFDQADWVPASAGGSLAVPDPTSAFAPPPMMLAHDGGVVDASAGGAAAAAPPPTSDCAADCQQSLDACREGCKTAPCEKACAARYKRCTKRCK